MARKINDPGFGNTSAKNIQRFVNKNGTFNIRHLNNKNRISAAYSYLVDISWLKLFILIIVAYSFINIVFASIYLLFGIEQLTEAGENVFRNFLNAFFFSAQTITTVGYGYMAPKGIAVGFISSFEALLGLLSFSFITGLLYSRFAKPKGSIKFSDVILYRKFKEGNALMFRLMNKKTSNTIQPKIKVLLALSEKKAGGYHANYYQLELEREQLTYLPTTWTIVHEITEKSPLYRYDKEALKRLHAELIVLLSYYDESFNQEIHQAHSFLMSELVVDRTFVPAFHFDENGITVLDHSKLSETIPF